MTTNDKYALTTVTLFVLNYIYAELVIVDDGEDGDGGGNGLSLGTLSGILGGGITIIIIGGGTSLIVIFLFKKKNKTKSVGM